MKKFIQKAHMKKGTLHKQLGIAQSKKIPTPLLKKIRKTKIGTHVRVRGKSLKVTTLLKRRVLFALKLRSF